MSEEIASLKENNAWDLMPLPKDGRAIGCRWVFTTKTDTLNNIVRFKARLVAQGYSQQFGIDYNKIFAPVVKHTTLRTLLSIAGTQNQKVYHFDVKTAFLNGELHETIYMKQPPGFEAHDKNIICKLNKCLYGLKQSARSWNQTIHTVLITGGYQQSQADQCLYSKFKNGIWTYILIYVDDFIVASKELNHIIELEILLKKNFEIKNLGELKYYLGLEVDKDDKGNYRLSQKSYIEKIIKDAGLDHSKISSFPLDPGYGKHSSEPEVLQDNIKYQQLIGSLLYIATNTRPDISASISILARKVSLPTSEDWTELKRLIRYLKGTVDLKLNLSQTVNGDIMELIGYADADWAEDRKDRKSNTGYVFMLNGGCISWTCKKQSCVALSSSEAEFIALSEATKEAVWLQNLLNDFKVNHNVPTRLWEDNQSCLKMIENPKLTNRSKHIDTKFYYVKDIIDKGLIECRYCPSIDMIADLLTKPLPAARVKSLRERCGLLQEFK